MFLSELSEGIEFDEAEERQKYFDDFYYAYDDEAEDIEFLGKKSCRRNNDCRSYEFCNDNGKCVEDDTGSRCKYLGSFHVCFFVHL